MDTEDLRLFEASLRKAVERGSMDEALDSVGWYDAIPSDPSIAASAFAVQGELNLASSALDDVVVATLGLTPTATTAVVLPALDSHDAPASGSEVFGLGTQRLHAAERVVVVSRRDGEHVAGTVDPSSLTMREIAGLDPAGGWLEVTGTIGAPTDETAVDWNAAVAAGQRAIATELTAASRAMLGLARNHAVERVQFGRPIGSFQAIRHKLADSLLAVESAQAAVDVAWNEPSAFAAAMAKAIAGRSAKSVAKHSQQVLAGMGFTSEHPFHRYLKRTMVLDQLFRSSAAISAGIGAAVLRDRTVPAKLPL